MTIEEVLEKITDICIEELEDFACVDKTYAPMHLKPFYLILEAIEDYVNAIEN